MRSENIVLLGICCLVAMVIGWMFMMETSPNTIFYQLRAQLTGRGTTMGRVEAELSEPPKEEKKDTVKRTRPANATKAAIVPEPVAAAPATPATPPPPPPSQPEPEDILLGMARADLLNRYPRPALQTSTLKGGDLVELIVYQKEEGRKATFAQLENGVVSQVYAGTAPRRLPGR